MLSCISINLPHGKTKISNFEKSPNQFPNRKDQFKLIQISILQAEDKVRVFTAVVLKNTNLLIERKASRLLLKME